MRAPWILAAPALLALASARPAAACATAPPPGMFVEVAEESAIIAFDSQARREHFIRRASFRKAGKDFGFLVPTPAIPELAAVPDAVFDALEQATKPQVIVKTGVGGVEPSALCGLMFFLRSAPSVAVSAAPARVLAEQRVAGYDAVVLEADEPLALATWLKEHGYAARPDLSDWLAPYVAARWKITAFKIAGDAPEVGTQAVRMSFATERPFFPYREPADQRGDRAAGEQQRLLRVFFLGDSRVEGTIGAARAPWPGKALWSNSLSAAHLERLVGLEGALPSPVPASAWLTMFEDSASPRPGTDDLFFTSSAGAGALTPDPVIVDHREKIPIPVDVLAGLGVVGWVFWRRRKKIAGAPKSA